MEKRQVFFLLVLLFSGFTASSQNTIILHPGPEGKDAYINDYYSYGHGDYPNLFAMSGTSGGDYFQSRSLMEFDLSAIPPGSSIIEAKLSLYFANNQWNPHTHFGENSGLLKRVVEPWEESTVSWWNQPATVSDNQVRLPMSSSPTQNYTDIDVLGLIQDIFSNPETSFGILLRLETESGYRRLMFASGDHDNPNLWPKLEITYLGCAPPAVSFEYELDGLTASFTGISPTALNWHWDFGDGDTSNLQNPEHVYDEQGNYEVCLWVEDTCYFAEYCEMIQVCTGPPQAGFEYTSEELSVYFQDTSSVAVDYYWDFGDGYYSNLSNPWHEYEYPGEYYVCQYVWNNCGADTACQIIDLCLLPDVQFDYYIDDMTVYFENYTQNGVTYYWDFGDGYFSSQIDPYHTFDYIGNYYVCLMSWNECGSDTACEMIYMSGLTSLADDKIDGIKVYPNPAREIINIAAGNEQKLEITLLDLNGKVIKRVVKEFTEDEDYILDISYLSNGFYLLKLTGSSLSETRKILKIE